jgi:hypothetical protein
LSPPPDGRERRKVPDPTTPRLLLTWALALPATLWAAQKFFKARFFVEQEGARSLTPQGAYVVFAAAAALAVLVSAVFYKFKYGKFHLVWILRVVRGILTLFLLTLFFFWPISMMVIALNPGYTGSFILLNAAAIGLLTLVIRLSGPPEAGFWRDWLHDTLLRW